MINKARKSGDLSGTRMSLRENIKRYLTKAERMEEYLRDRPHEWGKFQVEFNDEVNSIFREILGLEKMYCSNGEIKKLARFKDFFVRRFRDIFLKGAYIEWSLRKPYGYAGDFKIIDDIYNNEPGTVGFARLFDNYYQMSSICVAVRNRKKDFKRIITDLVESRERSSVRIMNLACGSCRDIHELFSLNKKKMENTVFECMDHDKRALDYAAGLIGKNENVNYYKLNALRLAAAREISDIIHKKYDLIYSTGLFDYLDRKISCRLVRNMKKLLNKKGKLAIASVRDKYSNPSVHFMEWVGDWNLIYRDEEQFVNIFTEAGFKKENLHVRYEQQGILQYIIADNS